MGYSCLECHRKISSQNPINLQCSSCNQFCHPKCALYCPPLRLKKSGNYRYKRVRNKNWQCESCVLRELPFYDVSDSQLITIATKQVQKNEASLPSCDELNNLFVVHEDDIDTENVNELNPSSIVNDARYMYSSDVGELNFNNEVFVYDNFPMISLNIRSIVNRDNFTKFESFLENLEVKPLVIALNETWITSRSTGPYQSLKGYQFVQNHRTGTVGGGVAFYISDEIHFNRIDSLSIMKEKIFESLFIDVEIEGQSIICGTVYRSPTHNHDLFLSNLTHVLKEGTKINKKIIITGDMNYDILDTQDNSVTSFTDNFFEFGFFPLINIPTRITNTTAKVLDQAWTNILDLPIQAAVLCNPVSDHLPIIMNLAIKKHDTKQPVRKRNFSEQNISKFNGCISEIEIRDILNEKRTDNAYDVFINRYLKVFDDCFPYEDIKPSKKRFKNDWYTADLKDLNDIKERNYNRFIHDQNNKLLERRYLRSKNKYYNKIKTAKKQYFQKLFVKVKHNIKSTWKVINSVLGRNRGKQLFKLRIDGEEVTDETKIADEFNDYFSNVANNLVDKIPNDKKRKHFSHYLPRRNNNSLIFNPTSLTEVLKLANKLSSMKSSG